LGLAYIGYETYKEKGTFTVYQKKLDNNTNIEEIQRDFYIAEINEVMIIYSEKHYRNHIFNYTMFKKIEFD
jgi:hypothetical protein